jgi:hypothetical protein
MRPPGRALNVAVTSTGGRHPALVAVVEDVSDITDVRGHDRSGSAGHHQCGCGAVPAREKP